MNDAPTSSLVHYNECTGHLGAPCVCEPPLTTVDEVAALMFACHEIEYIDAESGWACGCDEDGFLELWTLDDARRHQAEATMAILRPLLAAEFSEGMADTLKAEADSIRKSAGEFIGDDLLAYVQGIEYSVDRLRGAPQVEVGATR